MTKDKVKDKVKDEVILSKKQDQGKDFRSTIFHISNYLFHLNTVLTHLEIPV